MNVSWEKYDSRKFISKVIKDFWLNREKRLKEINSFLGTLFMRKHLINIIFKTLLIL